MKPTTAAPVALLVALAGCTGMLQGTPADGPGAPSLDEVTLPEGVSEDGTELAVLSETHADALENRSFALALSFARTGAVENQSVTMRAAVGPDRERILAHANASGRQVDLYTTAEKQYQRVATGDGYAYRAGERTAGFSLAAAPSGTRFVDRFGGPANFTPTGVRVENGTTLVELTADGADLTAAFGDNATAFEGTLLVDERGVIHSMSVAVETADAGTVEFSLSVSGVGGTTVAEPDWLEEARAASDRSEG